MVPLVPAAPHLTQSAREWLLAACCVLGERSLPEVLPEHGPTGRYPWRSQESPDCSPGLRSISLPRLDPCALPGALARFPTECLASDAMKVAFRESRNSLYHSGFNRLRKLFLSAKAAPPT
jgi:hypothetical protein